MPLAPEELLQRLRSLDTTLWPEGNVAKDRLGWLASPREMARAARDLRLWADAIDQEVVVLLGMGGSSLGPLVLASIAEAFGAGNGRRLFVCDTTDPATVAATPLEDAFVIVSSKSGTTLEPNVLFDYARSRVADPKRYALITDPGTPLAGVGTELGVQRLFENRPDIGGRYSVLSHFGMVPAALLGYDIAELCERALDLDLTEAVELGLTLGQAAREGRDKATIRVGERERSFGLWLEQLIAESTGKHGRGIVPVPTGDEEHGDDRCPVEVGLADAHGLGEAFLRFEVATAIAGHVLEIDPFDEPNVAESKANTNRVLADLPLPPLETAESSDLDPFLEEQLRPGDYVSLQAYLPYGSEDALARLRAKVRDEHDGIAVTAGYGPRFLHSTGQLHKGGPNRVVAVQLVGAAERPVVPIPSKPYDFATLIAAQAIGDRESLRAHGRRLITIAVDNPAELL